MLAHPRQQSGDHGDADDRVGQLEQLPAVGIHRVTRRAVLARGVRDVRRDQVGGPLSDHVARHPAGHPAHLGELAGPEPEHGPPPEPGSPQRREQGGGLGHDAERGADPEQLHGGRRDRLRRLVQAKHHHVQAADDDDDQVVDDRCPHRCRESAPGIQDRRDEGAHPVEEDLRDEEVRPHHHEIVLGALDGGGIQVDQRPGGQRGHQRDREQRDHAQGEDPLRVGLAVVGIALGRLDQQRHHDAGEDAAQHQVVDGVRQRVGEVVVVGQRQGAERGHEDEGAQEPGDARGERPCRHAGAGPDQAGPLPAPVRRRWSGRPRRSGRRLSGAVPGGLGLARRRVLGGPGHSAPVGGRPGRQGCSRRGRAPVPRRPGGRGGPAERQRQRGLGRSRAAP